MKSDLISLAEKRGELKARIAMQRDSLGQNVWPVAKMLGVADKAVDGVHWLKRHPGAAAAAVLAVVAIKPRRTLRVARRGFTLWQTYRKLRNRLTGEA